MDNNDRRQRQNLSGYASQPGALLQSHAQYPVASAPERFRQAPLTAPALPPASAPPGSRASAHGYGYAYDPSAQYAGTTMQQSYGTHEYVPEQQPQRGPQYSHYSQNVLYNVPGAQAPPAGPSQYGQVQPYQQSREPAMELVSGTFGAVAQGQYYSVPGQTAAAPATAMGSTHYPLGYTTQQAQVGRESLAPSYSDSGMADPQQATAQGTYSPSPYSEQKSNTESEEFLSNYQTQLKKTNECTRDGRLRDAAMSLMSLSDGLFRWAENLGLTRDEEGHHQERLELWDNFNKCWLATLQRQKDMMEEYLRTGHGPQAPKTLIEDDYLLKMGNEVVRQCDVFEKYGLVDYQMGVAEEEIIAMLTACRDLWEKAHKAPARSGPSQRAPSQTASRH